MTNNDNMVLNKNWDILVILDACRYDYFAGTYEKYFSGKLEKLHSAGSATPEWRSNNFTEFSDDIVYISSNPFIGDAYYYDFNGKEHFHKVYPVWKTNWDNTIGTVQPNHITDTAISANKQHRDKKMVVHYLQPHAPYLTAEKPAGFVNPNNSDRPFEPLNEDSIKNTFRGKLYKKALKFARKHKLFGNKPEWHIGQWLKLPPQTPMDAARRMYGNKKLRKLYQKNLDTVLLEVCTLLQNIDTQGKTIVISSDHGELLGEDNWFAHPVGSDNPILRNVPWFIWEKTVTDKPLRTVVQQTISTQAEDNTAIENKLKDLGYM